jgi:hypothetical protein
MIDFGIIILAHLWGDYILQNDWMAKNKTSSDWACAVHCAFYTGAYALFIETSGNHWPLWAYAAVFFTHYLIDRYRLAFKWMNWHDWQKDFAKNMAPWSIIIVDNTFHLAIAYIISMRVSQGPFV